MGHKGEDYKEGERYCPECQLKLSESETRRYLSLSLTTTQPLTSQRLQRTTTLVTLVLFPLQALTTVGNRCVQFDDCFPLVMKKVITEIMLYTSLDVIILRYTALVVVIAEGL